MFGCFVLKGKLYENEQDCVGIDWCTKENEIVEVLVGREGKGLNGSGGLWGEGNIWEVEDGSSRQKKRLWLPKRVE